MTTRMVSDDDFSDIENISASSSSSSDTYSYLLYDIENPDNKVSDEWEAIERTLYQEPENQVTNPVLLRECKLWRDSFPYFRVKGNKINIQSGYIKNKDEIEYENENENENDDEIETELDGSDYEHQIENENEAVKGTQTVNDVDPLNKLQEKREKIKKHVVGEIVQRLMTKLSLEKEKSVENDVSNEDLTINEKVNQETEVEPSAKSSISSARGSTLGKESYFERGKLKDLPLDWNKTPSRVDFFDDYSDLSDEWHEGVDPLNRIKPDQDSKSASSRLGKVPQKSLSERSKYDSKNLEPKLYSKISKNEDILKKGNIVIKAQDKRKPSRVKTDKLPDGLSSLEKPFEMTKKIDKKYEAMLENILKTSNNLKETNHVGKKVSSEVSASKSYRESLEKLRSGGNNYDDYLKRHKHLPKINKFQNNWMLRTENCVEDDYTFYSEEIEKVKPSKVKTPGGISGSTRKANGDFGAELDSLENNFTQWLDELKKEVPFRSSKIIKTSKKATDSCTPHDKTYNFLKELKGSPKYTTEVRSEIEEINYQRPKLFTKVRPNNTNVQKSSSCIESNRRKQTIFEDRSSKSGVEKGKSEVNLKKTTKTVKTKGRSVKVELNRNLQLPPIETGIICTELTGRPKVPPRTVPRKR